MWVPSSQAGSTAKEITPLSHAFLSPPYETFKTLVSQLLSAPPGRNLSALMYLWTCVWSSGGPQTAVVSETLPCPLSVRGIYGRVFHTLPGLHLPPRGLPSSPVSHFPAHLHLPPTASPGPPSPATTPSVAFTAFFLAHCALTYTLPPPVRGTGSP